MEYNDLREKLGKDNISNLISSISSIYEKFRYDNYVKWVKSYPDYWGAICEMERSDITPEYAEKVMNTLIESNILELQLVWLFKCGNNLDILGNAAEPDDKFGI